MARVKDLAFTGKMDQFIFYKMNEKYYVRTAPARVKQSKGTKTRSTNFAIAAIAGKVLRKGLHTIIPFPKDKQMQNRLSGAISKWLQLYSMPGLPSADNVPYVSGIQLSEGRALDERFKVSFVIHVHDDSLEIIIPAFVPTKAITAPKGTVSVDCSIAIGGCALKDGTGTEDHSTSFNIPYDNNELAAQTIVLPFTKTPGVLTVVAAALNYNISNHGNVMRSDNPAFMPCDVIKAMYEKM